MPHYTVAEVCAGAGGQALGLELAGFRHLIAVEIDKPACDTLRRNRPGWNVAEGDVASPQVWDPAAYQGVDLLAGGIPCQPFTVAGKQLGAADERDLYAWAIEACATLQPRALLLENVAGLSHARFAGYRQHVLDRLASLGYVADWRVLHASDYGVPQLRPRFILVAMRPGDFGYFSWPEPQGPAPTVGEALLPLMSAGGWTGAADWARRAVGIAPTIVGGSKKHGGPDLGPTRAKRAWRQMGVDALGIADAPPPRDAPRDLMPRLTIGMCSVLQGFDDGEYRWLFPGRKTAVYRQVGNAFPPPVARAVGEQVRGAFDRRERHGRRARPAGTVLDPVYAVLRADGGFLTVTQIRRRLTVPMDAAAVARHLTHLGGDFEVDSEDRGRVTAYRLGRFLAFTGQDEHLRHEATRRGLARQQRRPGPGAAPARRAG